ncbi:NAD-dependent epimerase/dehydratase family protein [Cytobacillus sp. Hz8]|uniref:NAD-dependent epimerase/dehydratase family protein n=1 Tax=Cytobacillus sp. Hz8 TaxID=3347168 RepID=UPI0035D72332
MKVIVTGGAGFIGSHLVDALIARGDEVHVLDNLSTGKLQFKNPQASLHLVNICSETAKKIIIQLKPDAVFHLAAQADVSKSILDPKYDAEVNLIGTINILEACRDASVKKFIFASTSAVYGNLQKEIIREDDPVHPASYYGLSKLAAENYIRIFYELYQLPFTILRYANVYGPRQLPKGEGGVIAVFLDHIQNKKSLSIHGDGEQSRDFIFVKDIVTANLAALDNENQQIFHASTAKKTSINQVVDILSDLHGVKIDSARTKERIGDIKHSCLDNHKIVQTLKWVPQIDILEGLSKTYAYQLQKVN